MDEEKKTTPTPATPAANEPTATEPATNEADKPPQPKVNPADIYPPVPSDGSQPTPYAHNAPDVTTAKPKSKVMVVLIAVVLVGILAVAALVYLTNPAG